MTHKNLNKIYGNIRNTLSILICLFIILIIYISYIQVWNSQFFATHPLNRRLTAISSTTELGRITDSKGFVLAHSITSDQVHYQRNYPLHAAAAHIIGYDSIIYGKTGLEGSMGGYLSGLYSPELKWGPIKQILPAAQGNDVVLTIDANLQKAAYQALRSQRGAIVVISPTDGAILAMVSNPSFNPENIDHEMPALATMPNSPLLDRTVQGLYPPGSTIKVMIAEAALREKVVDLNNTVDCKGSLRIGADYTLTESNNRAHGEINLSDALAVSCNITFGSLALKLGPDRLTNAFNRFGFNAAPGQYINSSKSLVPNLTRMTQGELAQIGIGQGSLLVTPLQMALLASSFANNGIIMKPYIVSEIKSKNGDIITKHSPEAWLVPSTPSLSHTIAKMMIAAVAEGTGGQAGISGVQVAGKTGTAENPHGAPHAWFIGFAPADNPQVALAIIVENAGSGGEVAAPIAKQILRQALH